MAKAKSHAPGEAVLRLRRSQALSGRHGKEKFTETQHATLVSRLGQESSTKKRDWPDGEWFFSSVYPDTPAPLL